MEKELCLTIFVAMTKHKVKTSLWSIAEQLVSMQSYGSFTITKVELKQKGRLHKAADGKEQTGSISLTLRYKDKMSNTYRKANALIFKSSIRITGSFPKSVQDEIHECITDEPLKDYLKMLLDGLQHWTYGHLVPEEDTIRIVNINAQSKKQPFPRFDMFCSEKLYGNSSFDRVQLPFFHECGAIGTCHVYPLHDSTSATVLQS